MISDKYRDIRKKKIASKPLPLGGHVTPSRTSVLRTPCISSGPRSPVVPDQLQTAPPGGGTGVLQAAQLDGHLLQSRSLALKLAGDQLGLRDTDRGGSVAR